MLATFGTAKIARPILGETVNAALYSLPFLCNPKRAGVKGQQVDYVKGVQQV